MNTQSTALPAWFWPVYGIFILFMIVAMWKIFVKAGRPGWESLIPIYNLYIMAKISGKDGWWLLRLLIPIAGIYFAVVLIRSFARSFGQGVGFTVGLLFLGIIFYPMIAFGDIKYVGPNGVATNQEDIDSIGNN
jgi:Family of unknown function (DUF5684)